MPRMTENEIYLAHVRGFWGLIPHHDQNRYTARLSGVREAFRCADQEALISKWGKASAEATAEALSDYRDSAVANGVSAAEINAELRDARALHRLLQDDGFLSASLPAVEPAYPDPVPVEIVEYHAAATATEDKKARVQQLQNAACAALVAQAVPVTQIQNLDAGDVTKNGIRVRLAHWPEPQTVALHPDALKIVAALAKARKKTEPLIESWPGRRAEVVTVLSGWKKLILQYDKREGERTGQAAVKGTLAAGAKVHGS